MLDLHYRVTLRLPHGAESVAVRLGLPGDDETHPAWRRMVAAQIAATAQAKAGGPFEVAAIEKLADGPELTAADVQDAAAGRTRPEWWQTKG